MPHPTTARLYVLGCLRRGPQHGYGVRREAQQDRVDMWSDLKSGSVYHALESLERAGYAASSDPEPEGRRPPKTTYEITPEGIAELRRLVSEGIETVASPHDPVHVALRLADELPASEVQELLARRVEALRERLDQHRAARAFSDPYLTGAERIAFDHLIGRLEFDLDWFSRLARHYPDIRPTGNE